MRENGCGSLEGLRGTREAAQAEPLRACTCDTQADGVLDAEQNDRGDGKGPGCDHHQPVELRAAGVRLCEYSQGVLEIRKIGDGLNQD